MTDVPTATPAASEPVTVPASEYAAVKQGCGLLDASERGKLALTGTQAKEFLHGQVTNEVNALVPGTGCYAAFLTHKGKMRGDLRILDLGHELFLDCERAVLQALFTLIHRYKLGRDVDLHKRTLERGLLSLLGPRSAEVAGAGHLPEAEHSNVPGSVAGVEVTLVRTWAGVDVICAAGDATRVSEALQGAGAVPISEGAGEVLRVEHGRPRYGVDLDESVIPQEAGLNESAVSFTKGCYVGQETVARLFYKGKPNRHLRTLSLSAPVPTGAPLLLGDREVGVLGSSVVSAEHGPIALAIVRREAQLGDTVQVGQDGVTARLRERPFES